MHFPIQALLVQPRELRRAPQQHAIQHALRQRFIHSGQRHALQLPILRHQSLSHRAHPLLRLNPALFLRQRRAFPRQTHQLARLPLFFAPRLLSRQFALQRLQQALKQLRVAELLREGPLRLRKRLNKRLRREALGIARFGQELPEILEERHEEREERNPHLFEELFELEIRETGEPCLQHLVRNSDIE